MQPAVTHFSRRALHWPLALVASLLLLGCGGSGDPMPPLQSVVVHNPGAQAVRFNLAINGARFFANDDDVVSEPAGVAAPGEDGFALALWQFMKRNRYHFEPYTAQRWGHSPTLFLNSLGYGLCDDTAAVTRALAVRRGMESRVWFLNGHLVAEIRSAGRWQVYDADLEVYYRQRDGRIAGVAELSADPTLISQPVQPLTEVSGSLFDFLRVFQPDFVLNIAPAYSQPYVDIYASTHDNWVEPWYDEVPEVGTSEPPLLLPPGASLHIAQGLKLDKLSFNGFSVPRAGTVGLQLADGWQGTLDLPLLVVDILGAGRLRIDGKEFDAGSAALQERLADRARGVVNVSVMQAERGLTVVLAVNAQRFELDQLRTVELLGERAQALKIVRQYAPAGG